MEVIWALSKSLACSRGLVKNFTFPIIEQTNHNISSTLLSGYIDMKNRFRNKTLHFLRLGLILLVCVLSSLEIIQKGEHLENASLYSDCDLIFFERIYEELYEKKISSSFHVNICNRGRNVFWLIRNKT